MGGIYEVPFEMGSGAMIYMPGFIRSGSDIQKFIGGILRHRQQGELKVSFYLKNVVFWDVGLCRYCVNRRFGGMYRLHLQGRIIRDR
jgi:hypothetical protein